VARRLAGGGALYWRRREFGYPSPSRVDPTRESATRRHSSAPESAGDPKWVFDARALECGNDLVEIDGGATLGVR